MDIFLHLFQNLIPLYALIFLGWVAGRYLQVDRQSLGALGIFLIQPIVSFGFVAQLEFKPSFLAVPIILYVLFSALLLLAYVLSKQIYKDKRANLLAMCSAMANTGYFGLPVAILLLEPQWVGVYIFANLAALMCEATIMYYIANRGAFDARESIMRVIKFPTVYAIIAGLFVNFSDIEMPQQVYEYWEYFKGSYIVIGMMIIGVALGHVQKLVIGPRFLSFALAFKFLLWPAVAWGLILLDQYVLLWFEPEIHKIIFIMAIVPQAANIAAYASQLNLVPEKAATTILIGTLFALFYIPIVLVLTGLY